MPNEGIARRDFLKTAAVGAMGIAAAGTITTAATAHAEEADAAPEGEPMPISAGGPRDGKYMTKALGHEDYVYVSTSLFNGAITACSVVSHNETMGIGNYACARIPAAIVANQSFNVPNVRGCSTTSRAIKDAVQQAIELAGYNVDDFSAEITDPDVNEEETIDVDVCIIGAGTAGLIAAAKLLEAGRSVLVLEKRAIPGGAMAMTYSGVETVGTETLMNYNVDGASIAAYQYNMDDFMSIYNVYVIDDIDRYNKTMPYEKVVYGKLSEASEWMKSIGIGFCTLGSYEGAYAYGSTLYLAPGCYMGGAGYAMMALEQRINKYENGDIKYMTQVTDLIQDGDGTVTGCHAVGIKSDDTENGYRLTVNAKATMLATGGFARNNEMLAEYSPAYSSYFFNCASGSTGEGIRMGVAAGSQVECAGRSLPAFLSSSTLFELSFLHYSTPGIMVNKYGDNVGNITKSNHSMMASCLLDENNGGEFYYVFDENSVPSTKNYLAYGFNTYAAMFDRGEVLHYGTVEEAAADLDLGGLAAAIEANNAAALSGEADEFGRSNCPYIDTYNGIYLMKVLPTFYLTSAGLCIDPDGHVLTDSYVMDGDNTVIPGLYAAGDVCGSVEEKDGKAYGMGFDCAMGFGYAVGEVIAAELA